MSNFGNKLAAIKALILLDSSLKLTEIPISRINPLDCALEKWNENGKIGFQQMFRLIILIYFIQ